MALSKSQRRVLYVVLSLLALVLIAAYSIWFDTGLHLYSAVL